jgi:hypothetical protein
MALNMSPVSIGVIAVALGIGTLAIPIDILLIPDTTTNRRGK